MDKAAVIELLNYCLASVVIIFLSFKCIMFKLALSKKSKELIRVVSDLEWKAAEINNIFTAPQYFNHLQIGSRAAAENSFLRCCIDFKLRCVECTFTNGNYSKITLDKMFINILNEVYSNIFENEEIVVEYKIQTSEYGIRVSLINCTDTEPHPDALTPYDAMMRLRYIMKILEELCPFVIECRDTLLEIDIKKNRLSYLQRCMHIEKILKLQ